MPHFPTSGLYCLTDDAAGGRSHLEQARECLRGGAAIIQLRDKRLSRKELKDQASRILALCRKTGAVFIINDDPGLAAEIGADGVHVGQDDTAADEARRLVGPERIVGLSTHTLDQVRAANDAPVDYIGFGPMFTTATKTQEHAPRGVDMLREAIAISRRPVVPIGGITFKNLPSLVEAGARHAAVISAITRASDIAVAARRMASLL